MNIEQLARYVIGLTWIYHGVFPKLLQVAPLEQAMTASLGFPADTSYMLTKVAGILEVLFGLVFICFYRLKAIQVINIVALAALLAFVIVMIPSLLFEAFNPVTTNIPLIVLGLYLLDSQPMAMKKTSTIGSSV